MAQTAQSEVLAGGLQPVPPAAVAPTVVLPGPAGPPGPSGPSGPSGPAGSSGPSGANGKDGKDGDDGKGPGPGRGRQRIRGKSPGSFGGTGSSGGPTAGAVTMHSPMGGDPPDGNAGAPGIKISTAQLMRTEAEQVQINQNEN